MRKTFSVIMLIIGTVIGSGFASGKEISVFFSRFGNVSYFFIAITFFLFWGIIYFFLSFGNDRLLKLTSSKIFSFLCIIISLIFTSSMFAGAVNVYGDSHFIKILISLILIIICCYVSRRGVPFLEKLNVFLIPSTLICMAIVLFSNVNHYECSIVGQNAFAGLFFTLLYSALNFSISGVVIAKSGSLLSKKQKVWASFLSSFTLSCFLMLTNFVILSNPECMEFDMPLISLSNGFSFVLIRFVVFSGCITTLFSLVFTTSETLKKFNFKQNLIYFVSILFPVFVSVLGFGHIVSLLYPFASVLGVIFFLSMFLSSDLQHNSS